MRTNVKATNWPTRADAAHNVPRESCRGEKVASRRTYEARGKAAAARDLDKLLALATRHYARVAGVAANVAREHELTIHTDHVVATSTAAAIDYARRNA